MRNIIGRETTQRTRTQTHKSRRQITNKNITCLHDHLDLLRLEQDALRQRVEVLEARVLQRPGRRGGERGVQERAREHGGEAAPKEGSSARKSPPSGSSGGELHKGKEYGKTR